jgi:NAD-dependent SIR2 family protein deacetylase
MKIEEKDVFISYHESIAEQVSDLNKKLNLKFQMCMQRKQSQIKENSQLTLSDRNAQDIKKSKVFLCCLTKEYVECFDYRKEFIYASRLEKKIIILNYGQVNFDEDLQMMIESNLENLKQIQFDSIDLIKESIETMLKV